jgi:hypothetical protein
MHDISLGTNKRGKPNMTEMLWNDFFGKDMNGLFQSGRLCWWCIRKMIYGGAKWIWLFVNWMGVYQWTGRELHNNWCYSFIRHWSLIIFIRDFYTASFGALRHSRPIPMCGPWWEKGQEAPHTDEFGAAVFGAAVFGAAVFGAAIFVM